MTKTRNIGVLNEGALHAALKAQYVGADGQVEVPLATSLPMFCVMG